MRWEALTASVTKFTECVQHQPCEAKSICSKGTSRILEVNSVSSNPLLGSVPTGIIYAVQYFSQSLSVKHMKNEAMINYSTGNTSLHGLRFAVVEGLPLKPRLVLRGGGGAQQCHQANDSRGAQRLGLGGGGVRLRINTTKRVTLSDWRVSVLTEEQLRYVYIDTYASHRLGCKLIPKA
ncbi:hypothetical protein Cgig2_032398 [Carnegiea gigantea]|uniref:Uncharacterized protein n=1 Tax=Carnegiea gigantea TaxID=171969 RepID=A0A9Q1GJW8_9CARY|nr:hypothetical protein Cgig2_032398 [Carnegiea gigantea]